MLWLCTFLTMQGVDGSHEWRPFKIYTVFGELTRLGELRGQAGRWFGGSEY